MRRNTDRGRSFVWEVAAQLSGSPGLISFGSVMTARYPAMCDVGYRRACPRVNGVELGYLKIVSLSITLRPNQLIYRHLALIPIFPIFLKWRIGSFS